MDIGNGVHEVMGLVDDDNVPLHRKFERLPGGSLQKQRIWKSYDLLLSVVEADMCQMYRVTHLAVVDDRTGSIVRAYPYLLPKLTQVFNVFDCCKGMIAKVSDL